MRMGLMQGADRGSATVADIVHAAQAAEAAGFDSLWMAHIRSLDAISALTVAGTQTERIELGTAVTPIFPRHPMALAQQALTAAQTCAGRFTLGIGVSHRVVVEGMLGLSYERPARTMRDYLGALLPLLDGDVANYEGEQYVARDLQIDVADAETPPLVIAALGPVMLKLAAAYSAGTNTWMVGPQTIRDHIAPTLNAAARDCGRDAPRIIAGVPLVLTAQVEQTRARLAEALAVYGQLPSYRAMLDREGVNGPESIALVGTEETLSDAIASYDEAGVTDLNVAIMAADDDERQRSLDFLAELNA